MQSRTMWGDADLSHEDHEDWTTRLALPKKVESSSLENLGESPRLLRADCMSNSELTWVFSARNKTTERSKRRRA